MDPITQFEIIKNNFIRYVKTAFRTKFPEIEKERETLLNTDGVFYRQPWIEPLPDYESSNKKIDDLDEKNTNYFFKELTKRGLFPATLSLYKHQLEMFEKALNGNNCVITSGTGSGKTESFLLPLFAQISKKMPNPKRTRALRALILYPMNALVEDQMSRLRKALDSDEIRNWLIEEANGDKIYFGRYNSSTPTSGDINDKEQKRKIEKKLEEEKKKIEENLEKIKEYIEQNKNENVSELKPFFQQVDGAEMFSRFDMQKTPPDILITNYSMLSIMLMRQIDSPIFEKTKNWLKESKEHIFHLIVDELHLYRGSSGTEVAYLLKLVLDRLGLKSDSPQLRILASSASLEVEDKSLDFLEDFFGTRKFEIIAGDKNVKSKVKVWEDFAKDKNIDREWFKENEMLPNSEKERFRFHYFFKNIEGLWAEIEQPNRDKTVGKLYSIPNILGDDGNRILELLYCENCGTLFYGGSRLITKEANSTPFELLSGSPNIEGIPEKTQTKLIEKRTYQEYAVFWPKGEQDYQNEYDDWRQSVFSGTQYENHGKWIKAQINKISGNIKFEHGQKCEDEWIDGYLFQVVGNKNAKDIVFDNKGENHKAMPCVCPACGINYAKYSDKSIKKKTSPVRGFRTGFAQSTQRLSKELILALPKDSRKLVVFSDSREDAAQVANGIERSHYHDLMRELFIKILKSHLNPDQTLLDSWQYKAKIYNPNVKEREEFRKRLDLIDKKTISVKDLIDADDNLSDLEKEFYNLGVNPGGNNIEIQQPKKDDSRRWFEFIVDDKWTDSEVKCKIREEIYKKLAEIFFGQLFYSLEASGLGYLCIDPTLKLSINSEIINSCIRILGDSYKHNKVEDNRLSWTNGSYLPKKVKQYLKNLNIDPNDIFKIFVEKKYWTKKKELE